MGIFQKVVGVFNRGKYVTDRPVWKCPNCGKPNPKGALGGGGVNPGDHRGVLEDGKGSCIYCHRYFSLADIYCGRYDA